MGNRGYGKAALAATAAFVLALAYYGCGGDNEGGGGAPGTLTQVNYTGKTTQSDVTAATVTDTLNGTNLFIPGCQQVVNFGGGVQGKIASAKTVGTSKIIMIARTLAATTTPSDVIGDCGGKITFPAFNQNGGVASGTASFVNFCSTNATSHNTTTVNGNVPFAITQVTNTTGGTSTSKVSASAPLLTVVKKDANGNTLETSNVGVAGLNFSAGVPGGHATDANPDVLTITEISVQSTSTAQSITGAQNRSAMVRNLNVTLVPQVDGSSKITASGRLYRGESGFTDFTTPNPIVLSPTQTLAVGNSIVFTGANNSKATLKVTTANPLLFSADVNGTAVNSQLSCSNITIPPVTLP